MAHASWCSSEHQRADKLWRSRAMHQKHLEGKELSSTVGNIFRSFSTPPFGWPAEPAGGGLIHASVGFQARPSPSRAMAVGGRNLRRIGSRAPQIIFRCLSLALRAEHISPGGDLHITEVPGERPVGVRPTDTDVETIMAISCRQRGRLCRVVGDGECSAMEWGKLPCRRRPRHVLLRRSEPAFQLSLGLAQGDQTRE